MKPLRLLLIAVLAVDGVDCARRTSIVPPNEVSYAVATPDCAPWDGPAVIHVFPRLARRRRSADNPAHPRRDLERSDRAGARLRAGAWLRDMWLPVSLQSTLFPETGGVLASHDSASFGVWV